MFEVLDAFFGWLGGLSLTEWLLYFWPFFFIDLTRYTIIPTLGLVAHRSSRQRSDRKRQKARGQLYRDQPLVSILIPGKDEGPNLAPLIRSLRRQTYENLEIIIVDDGSEDRTSQIVRHMKAQGRIDKFIRQRVRGGKASAANTGLRVAEGMFIVHIDADSYLRDDAIEEVLLPFYMEDDVGAIGGDLRVANRWASLATCLQTFEYLKSISVGRTVGSHFNILRIVAGAFGAFRTETLHRLGGWDVGPGLDGDLTLKIRKLGLKIRHEPNAVCYTNAPTDFSDLWNQRYRWGRSVVRFRMRKHQDLLNPWSPFRASDFLSVLDNIFFSVILNAKWWIYLVQILLFHLSLWPFILATNLILYTVNNVISLGIIQAALGPNLDRGTGRLVLFAPLMSLYMGFYLRGVRTLSYLMELLYSDSYWDSWNPWKVSKQARKEGV